MTTPSTHTKSYQAPALVELGPVAKLTEVTYKTFGASDGFTYQGAPIMNASV
jgi:hypothetical protein